MNIEKLNIIRLSDKAFMEIYYRFYISKMTSVITKNIEEEQISDEIMNECMKVNPRLCNNIMNMKNKPLF